MFKFTEGVKGTRPDEGVAKRVTAPPVAYVKNCKVSPGFAWIMVALTPTISVVGLLGTLGKRYW